MVMPTLFVASYVVLTEEALKGIISFNKNEDGMSNLLIDRFKLYNIQFNLKKLSDGREIIAFLRYAWYVDECSPK